MATPALVALASIPDSTDRQATIRTAVATLDAIVLHPEWAQSRKLHRLFVANQLKTNTPAGGVVASLLTTLGFSWDERKLWFVLPESVGVEAVNALRAQLLSATPSTASAATPATATATATAGDEKKEEKKERKEEKRPTLTRLASTVKPAGVDAGPPSRWTVAQWRNLKIHEGLSSIGRSTAHLITDSVGIRNRISQFIQLARVPSISPGLTHPTLPSGVPAYVSLEDELFEAHVRPFLRASKPDGATSSSTSPAYALRMRVELVRSQVHAALVAFEALPIKDKIAILADQPAAGGRFAPATWKIWGSSLANIFSFLQPLEVNQTMQVCVHWKQQSERNRVWRPIVIRQAPDEDFLSDSKAQDHLFWRSRWLALHQYRRFSARWNFGRVLLDYVDPCLSDVGQPFGVDEKPSYPEAIDFPLPPAFVKYGWEETNCRMARDRTVVQNRIPVTAQANPVLSSLVHFKPWRVAREFGEQNRAAVYGERPVSWMAEVPAGRYRVWVMVGDAAFSSRALVFVNGQRLFSAADEKAQPGWRSASVTVDVPRGGRLWIGPVPHAEGKSGEAKDAVSDRWSCPACTYNNTGRTTLTCEICGTANPAVLRARSSHPPFTKADAARLCAISITDVKLFTPAPVHVFGPGVMTMQVKQQETQRMIESLKQRRRLQTAEAERAEAVRREAVVVCENHMKYWRIFRETKQKELAGFGAGGKPNPALLARAEGVRKRIEDWLNGVARTGELDTLMKELESVEELVKTSASLEGASADRKSAYRVVQADFKAAETKFNAPVRAATARVTAIQADIATTDRSLLFETQKLTCVPIVELSRDGVVSVTDFPSVRPQSPVARDSWTEIIA